VIGDLGRMDGLTLPVTAAGATLSDFVDADSGLIGKDEDTPVETANAPAAPLFRGARCVWGGEDWYTARCCTLWTWFLFVLLVISLSAADHWAAARLGDNDAAVRTGDEFIMLDALPTELLIALPITAATGAFRKSTAISADVGERNVEAVTCEYDRLWTSAPAARPCAKFASGTSILELYV